MLPSVTFAFWWPSGSKVQMHWRKRYWKINTSSSMTNMKPPAEDTTLEPVPAGDNQGQSGMMHIDHPAMEQLALEASQPFP